MNTHFDLIAIGAGSGGLAVEATSISVGLAGEGTLIDLDGDGEIDHVEGVDLNRNFPFQWGALGQLGSSSRRRVCSSGQWIAGSDSPTPRWS